MALSLEAHLQLEAHLLLLGCVPILAVLHKVLGKKSNKKYTSVKFIVNWIGKSTDFIPGKPFCRMLNAKYKPNQCPSSSTFLLMPILKVQQRKTNVKMPRCIFWILSQFSISFAAKTFNSEKYLLSKVEANVGSRFKSKRKSDLWLHFISSAVNSERAMVISWVLKPQIKLFGTTLDIKFLSFNTPACLSNSIRQIWCQTKYGNL